ncbi:unnamed protein product, partial [Porites evermanni]
MASVLIDSVSIDNEYDYENEILPLTIMRMRFAQNTCSTRSGNSFHDEISSKTRSARNEFLKASFKMNQPETKRKLFIWKRQHDSCLLREVLHLEPYNQKHRTRMSCLHIFYKNDNEYEYEMDSFSYSYSLSMLTLSI